MKDIKQVYKFYIQLIGASLLLLGSLTVIIGWFLNNNYIIRLHPNFSVMPFNTAISIFAIGISLFVLLFERIWIARSIAIIVGIFLLLTIVEHVFDWNLWIDELFFSSEETRAMTHPGRMALNTAIALFLCAICVFLRSYASRVSASLIVLTLGCFVFTFASVSLFGYLSGFEFEQNWALESHMGLHTALFIFIMGIIFISASLIDSLNSKMQLITFPIAIGVSIFGGGIATVKGFQTKENLSLRKSVDEKASYLSAFLQSKVNTYSSILSEMATTWEIIGGGNPGSWKEIAESYLQRFPNFFNLELFDKNFDLINGISRDGSRYLSVRLEKHKAALKAKKTILYFSIGKNRLIALSPIFVSREFQGCIASEIDLQSMIKSSIKELKLFESYLFFEMDNIVLFRFNETSHGMMGNPIIKNLCDSNLPIIMHYYLPPESAASSTTRAVVILMYLSAFFVSLFSSAAVFFALSFKRQREELHLLNEENIRSREKAENATQAKSVFLATMSHEIRTPLNAMLGSIQLLQETNIDELQRRYISRVESASKLLLNLINDLLDFSKIEAGSLHIEKTSVNLPDVFYDVSSLLFEKARSKNLEFVVKLPPQPIGNVLSDPHRIQQIAYNLLMNAIKFTEKGFVKLILNIQSSEEKNLTFRIEVKDTGIGIPKEHQERLFEKFTQVEISNTRKYGGVGLGLSICKKLSELMGGKIGMDTEEGKGSTFWIEITVEKDPSSPQPSPIHFEKKTVFLTDTWKEEEQVIKDYLASWNLEVISDMNNSQGVDIAILSSDQKELIEKFQEKKASIILLKNDEEPTDAHVSLTRPILPKDLQEIVQKSIGK